MARTRFTVKEGLSVADDTTVGGYPLIPTGTVMAYAGAAAPDGWLLCNGAAVSRTTYANLWALVSSTYGGGDGTTTFNVPDMRSRMPIGAGSGTGLTTRALAATGGVETVTIASGNLPTHQHTLSGHTHNLGSHTHSLQSHTHGITVNGNNFNTSGHSVDHSHSGTSGFASGDHNHVANRSAIATAGTNRLVVSTTTSDSGFTTAGSGTVHTHATTTGGASVDHSHNANHGHSASSDGPSNNTSGPPSADSGAPSSDTTGNGGFANTALAMMNPFLALNYIIKY